MLYSFMRTHVLSSCDDTREQGKTVQTSIRIWIGFEVEVQGIQTLAKPMKLASFK